MRAFAKGAKGHAFSTEIDGIMNDVAWDIITHAELEMVVKDNPHVLPLRLERFLEGQELNKAGKLECERELTLMNALLRRRGSKKEGVQRKGEKPPDKETATSNKRKQVEPKATEIIVLTDSDEDEDDGDRFSHFAPTAKRQKV